MKPRFVDPFTPNRPIDDPSRFFGREESVNELVDSLFQFANNNPKHTIITGDRGVGKSSLLTQVFQTAKGDNQLTDRLAIDRGVSKYNFLCVWHDVDSSQGTEEVALGILQKFDGEFKKILSGVNVEINLGEFVKLSRERAARSSISAFVDQFTERLCKLSRKATEQGKNGVLIFIDEIDRVKLDSGVSTFFKLTCEKLSRDGVKNVGFICAGITGAIQKLEDEHASILRTFRDVPLLPFNEDEVAEILMDGFRAAIHYCDITELKTKLFEITIGLPEPTHLLGSEMLSVDTDGVLDASDLDNAIRKIVTDVRKNKLTSILKKAGTGKYQKILQAIANYDKKIVPLDFISKKIGQEQYQFSTNMSTLIDREVISKPSIGHYAFCDPMLKEYIRTFGVLSLEE